MDPHLIKTIKTILAQNQFAGPLIVSIMVFIFAMIVSKKVPERIILSGFHQLSMIIENSISASVKSTITGLTPLSSVMLPVPLSNNSLLRIERVQERNTASSQYHKNLVISLSLSENRDKIILTNKQLDELNILSQEIALGSITGEEVILRLRGGDNLGDLVAMIVMIWVMNWLSGTTYFQQSALTGHIIVKGKIGHKIRIMGRINWDVQVQGYLH